MDDLKKIYLFEKASVPRAVMTMAVPTVISSLVTVIYNLADTYFVGMLNEPVQNAAVTLASPVMLAFYAVTNLFGVGCSSMMSRELGIKNYDMVRRISAFGFYCAIISGLLFSFVYVFAKNPILTMLGTDTETVADTAEYLKWTVACGAAPAILNIVMAYMVRSEGAALHAGIGTMSGCLLNIVLDPFFILPWGLNMGAAGAGLATFISNCVACAYFLVLTFAKRNTTYVSLNPKKFIPNRYIVSGVCIVGIPAAIQNLLNVTGMTVLNNMASSYNSSAVAAIGIAQKINMVPMYVALGASQGVMPLVSYSYAANDFARMKHTIMFSAKIIIAFLTGATVFYFCCSGMLIKMFMPDETTVAYGSAFMRGMCLALPFLATDFLAVGVFQAIGMGKKSLVFAIMRKIILEIPALYVLDKLFPLYGLAYAQTTAEIVLAIAAVIVLANIFKQAKNN